jgi:hypothetical protein
MRNASLHASSPSGNIEGRRHRDCAGEVDTAAGRPQAADAAPPAKPSNTFAAASPYAAARGSSAWGCLAAAAGRQGHRPRGWERNSHLGSGRGARESLRGVGSRRRLAAKAAGFSKTTILRAIKAHRISAGKTDTGDRIGRTSVS